MYNRWDDFGMVLCCYAVDTSNLNWCHKLFGVDSNRNR